MDFALDDEVGEAGRLDDGIGGDFDTGINLEAIFDAVRTDGDGEIFGGF